MTVGQLKRERERERNKKKRKRKRRREEEKRRVRVKVWEEKSERVRVWFCQKCSTGDWWIRTDCRRWANVTNDTADVAQTSIQEKIAVLEKTFGCMGNDEPTSAGNRVLEKELERHQKKLKGPKNNAKQIEAKQNWINREAKRIESAKLAEMQENLRVRKETLRGAYEETKILREDLLRRENRWSKTGARSCLPRARRKFGISNNWS